jgi:phosphomevalonate kinase
MNGNRQTVVRAPGKLILIGEYAVLEGATAMAMAVDVLAEVRPARRSPPPGDLVAFTRERIAHAIGQVLESVPFQADSSAFYHQGRKLGLGSSAAVTAAAAASVFHLAGRDIRDRKHRQQLWALARGAHNAYQHSQGSGLDLAASIFGGLVVMRPASEGEAPEFTTADLPADLGLFFLWSGLASSTPDMLAPFRRALDEEPGRVAPILADMTTLANELAGDAQQSSAAWLDIVNAYARQMDELGRSCGSPIVTDPMRSLFQRTRELGGAAKPSGAGGGDFVLLFLPGDVRPDRIARLSRETGFHPMELRLDAIGVRPVPSLTRGTP